MKQAMPNRRATVSRVLTASAPWPNVDVGAQEMLSKEVISKPNCAPEAFTSGFRHVRPAQKKRLSSVFPVYT